MEQRVSLITLAVADTAVSYRFYIEGLGWEAKMYVPGEVLFITVGAQLVLSLWSEAEFEQEAGPINRGSGTAPVMLAHNVATPAEVDTILAEAVTAGARLIAAGKQAAWGGYSGYFADPDGYHWEVAYNPDAIGQAVLDTE
ncbi:glyoxalase [Cryobacterium roopkundense]|uniref:Glyoxalase n=1 Tax=Cryobacterium roopkundense TaxID=1001240 RepID=A0A099JMP1_9MICO|nr:VOC family protein [Cryobacterium roopkundense]KGJ79614.1 glyoxalase [Cryobacterium roopkundense]MBB5639811.1 hypothetical protein [Cryobacterium roopkundense]